ncbi:DsbC family protein [Nitrogeniibacter aestuarii]|uniref:DsbC family protein n=1 Tax=Nitrogeniibacter aestuarii TaxID=2815343 RepID=UPI001E40EE79|nr:DsbC family protein [Nitrogeniibacter aestuarii]
MSRLSLLFAAIASLFSAGALAGSDESGVKAAIEAYARDVHVQEVHSTPVAGIYEVVAEGQVFHVDSTGRYAFVQGRLVDMKESRDLTEATIDRLSRVDFSQLPKDLALQTVRGTGRRKVAVFEDPSCSVCQSMQPVLDQLDDVTIYTYTYPVISPNSIPAAVAVWCSPAASRHAQWTAFMRGAPLPGAITKDCLPAGDVVKKIVDLGQALGVNNTPTIVMENGQRLVGATSLDQLVMAMSK